MGFRDDLETAVKDGFCAITAVPDVIFDMSNNLGISSRFGKPLPGVDLPRQVRNANDYFCNRTPTNPPPPPGAHGQCATDYRIRYTVEYTDRFRHFGPHDYDRNNIEGPFQGPFDKIDSDGNLRFIIIGPDGEEKTLSGVDKSGISSLEKSPYIITRMDGLPDDCGDPADRPPPTEADRTTEINIGGDNATLSIGQLRITGDGNVVAGVYINNNNYSFTGEVSLTGPSLTINVGDKRTTDDDDDDEPEKGEPDEDGGGIIGAVVDVSYTVLPDKVTVIPQPGNNPDIFIPNLGFVAFKVVVDETTTWSKDYPVKGTTTFIEWDGALDAVGVAGTPRPGVSFAVTPVRRIKKTTSR